MFKGLNFIGFVVQLLGVVIPVFGVGVAIFSISANNAFQQDPTLTPYVSTAAIQTTAFIYGVLSVVIGLVVFAFGGLIRAQVSIARDSRRTANALERLAYRQSQKSSAPSRVRQLERSE